MSLVTGEMAAMTMTTSMPMLATPAGLRILSPAMMWAASSTSWADRSYLRLNSGSGLFAAAFELAMLGSFVRWVCRSDCSVPPASALIALGRAARVGSYALGENGVRAHAGAACGVVAAARSRPFTC